MQFSHFTMCTDWVILTRLNEHLFIMLTLPHSEQACKFDKLGRYFNSRLFVVPLKVATHLHFDTHDISCALQT